MKYASDGRIPSRAHIDPVELGARVLPWIVILDVLRSGNDVDYRYRLIGTANVTLLGIDRTGARLSDNLDAADVAIIRKSFDDVVLTGKPVFTKAGLPHKQEFLVSVYRAFYPLAGDGVTVDKVIGAAIPEDVKQ
ncbi:PAS domain-containing protein [Hwanghaeella grinnelliae]|uniref:PAS domain-containing protein n=2 Tax=Hwanghaeella grinnelliae TaxID=2500179 RepID=A0A3S2ZC08_9PROT|nr:PAS domain-containing protein [Hwanghaeella grinnelliae]